MKPPVNWLVRLYPRLWRERYAEEFEALVEDTGSSWRSLPDIFAEALKMRLANVDYRFVALMAVLGLVVAQGIAFRLPERYTASATLHITPSEPNDFNQAHSEAGMIAGDVLSRTSLSNLIMAPDLRLYDQERRSQDMEEVIANMKAKDLRIAPALDGTLLVTYQGKSAEEARRTVERIVARLEAVHLARQTFLHYLGDERLMDEASLNRMLTRLEVRQAPLLPAEAFFPNRVTLAALGLGLGLLLAALIGIMCPTPGVWLFGSLGLTLATAATWLLPLPYEAAASVIFDSPATGQAVTADRARLTADVRNYSQILSAVPRSFYGLELERGAVATAYPIRVRHADPRLAQELALRAITRLLDETRARRANPDAPDKLNGPWLSVLEPPAVPPRPMGDPLRTAILVAGLTVSLLSVILLIFNRYRRQPGLESA